MKVHTLIENTDIQDEMHNRAVLNSGLYRGVTRPLNDIQLLPIRTDRTPRNSSIAQSILFDVCFQEHLGVKNIRRRALFCTTDFDVAVEYSFGDAGPGAVVEVMPLKSSKIAYHPRVSDSMALCEQLENDFARNNEDAQYLVNLLDEAQSSDSMESFTGALSQIDENKRSGLVAHLMELSKNLFNGYVVTGARSLEGMPGSFEVMVFDAPNYYASPIQDDGFGGDFYD